MNPSPPRSLPSPPSLEEQVEDYLDGIMTPREVRAFEASLVAPEVARALHEAVALRSLLEDLPPSDVPDGLIERIEAELGVAEAGPTRARLPRLRAALSGAAWAFRGPAQIQSGADDSMRAASLVSAPFTRLMARDEPRPPLWRRLLRLGA
ncbi:MAG: hypothetical protein JNJ59_08795 [Deltaproteobacteria bacterium]|nr:hypothetical protein [Deltaproteobacteria bacterium]